MKVSELRIGNIVKSINPLAEYCYITGISKDRIEGDTLEGGCLSEWNSNSPELKGIELTGAWLKKFGFKEKIDSGDRTSQYLTNGFIQLEKKEDGYVLTVPDRSYDSITVLECQLIRYVHMLQNLQFALTGEELTIKEHVS